MQYCVIDTSIFIICSGTVLDLPYRFVADGDHVQMERNSGFSLDNVMDMAANVAMASAAVNLGAEVTDECMDECCVVL